MTEELKIGLIAIAAFAGFFAILLLTMLILWGISYKVHPQNQLHDEKALKTLKGNWTIPVVSVLIFSSVGLVAQFIQQILSTFMDVLAKSGGSDSTVMISALIFIPIFICVGLVTMLFNGTLATGLYRQMLQLLRGSKIEVSDLFWALKDSKLRITSFLTILLSTFFTILWALLLIIPGIMAALSYALVYFIIADNPEIRPMDAIRKSKEMMNGHRRELFWLGCRFIGWSVLSLFTMFIGYLWLMPYYVTTFASFYEKLKSESNGSITLTKNSQTI